MVEPHKCLPKAELADIMGIHRNTLMKWINRNTSLTEELEKTGYVKLQKLLTPLQVSFIYRYFGSRD